jgi:hypothetical protein
MPRPTRTRETYGDVNALPFEGASLPVLPTFPSHQQYGLDVRNEEEASVWLALEGTRV